MESEEIISEALASLGLAWSAFQSAHLEFTRSTVLNVFEVCSRVRPRNSSQVKKTIKILDRSKRTGTVDIGFLKIDKSVNVAFSLTFITLMTNMILHVISSL